MVMQASLMNWRRVVIEVDNLDVVNLFSANAKVPRMCDTLYRTIINKSGNFEQLFLAWTPRGVNRLAHVAARSQFSAHTASICDFQKLQQILCDDVQKLQQILSEDKNGIPLKTKRRPMNLYFRVGG